MSFRSIVIPEQILQNSNFNKKISEICLYTYHQVQYIRQLIQKTHQIYGDLSKSVNKLTQQTQKKLSISYKPFWINSFITNINSIFLNILHKVNNHVVILKSKHNKLAKKKMDMFISKLVEVDQEMKKYLLLVDAYNKDGHCYMHDCEYFDDWEKNPIKYYSINQATNNYSKINKKEFQLRRKLQNVYKIKKELQMNIKEIRVSIKDYYQLLSANLNDYKKITVAFSDKTAPKLQYQPIIEDLDGEENSFRQREYSHNTNSFPNIRESPQPPKQLSFENRKKQVEKEYSKENYSCSLFLQFIEQLGNLIKKSEIDLENLLESREYKKMQTVNQEMMQFMEEDMEENRNICIKQIKQYKRVFAEVSLALNKVKIFKEINKNRNYNADKFTQQSIFILQNEKINKKTQYEKLQEKCNIANSQQMKQFRQKSAELCQEITNRFEFKKVQQSIKPRVKEFQIFNQKYFKILGMNFFAQKSEQPQFHQSESVKNYLSKINQNKLEEISKQLRSDAESQDNQETKTTCCGCIKVKSGKKRKSQTYSCALKEGIILVQGELKILPSQISFSTLTITNLFMGSTQLKIPRWDIRKAIKDRYIAMMIVILTTHGSIEFTSFITDPYEKIISIIPTSRQQYPKVQIIPFDNLELKELQERFQSHFRILVGTEGVITNNIQTYLSDAIKQLSITSEYQCNKSQIKGYFQIKIRKLKTAIEYSFKFSENTPNEMKKYISGCTKALIEGKYPKDQQPRESGQFDLKNISDITQKENKFQSSLSFIKPRMSNSIYNNQIMEQIPSIQIPLKLDALNQSFKQIKTVRSEKSKSQKNQQKEENQIQVKKIIHSSQSSNSFNSSSERRDIIPNDNRFITQGNTLSHSNISSQSCEKKHVNKNRDKYKTVNLERLQKYSTDDEPKFHKLEVINQKEKKKKQQNQMNPLLVIFGLLILCTLLSHSF